MRRSLALALLAPLIVCAQDSDQILRAMKDELARSKELRIVNLDPAYFFFYRLEDTQSFSATASLGALISSGESQTITPPELAEE